MRHKLTTIIMLTFSLLGICIMNACNDESETITIDQELYEMAKTTNGFTWYKNSSALLNKSIGSGHSQPFLRTRYNAIAATQLDTSGKIMAGTTFPEGSLIVKELYADETTLTQYAILYKDATSADADAKGWVWGYMYSDGRVAEPASKKGASCISCHAQADNIDYTLMNKYFP